MFKRRNKEGGFTLIELMIVIAVIGILAVVLIPKMSGVKDSAKESGVLTNVKSVEAYVVSNIQKWVRNSTNATDVANQIEGFFKDENKLTNPFSNQSNIRIGGADSTGEAVHIFTSSTAITASKGVVFVTVPSNWATAGIDIQGYDSESKAIGAAIKVKP